MAATDQVFVYQPLKQLTPKALFIQLVLFEYLVPNYNTSTSHVLVALTAQRVPKAFQQQVVTH